MQPTEDHDTPEAADVDLDLSKAYMLDLSPIPPGDYLAVVTKLQLARGPSGYPYFGMTFSLREPAEQAGKTVWKALSFAPTVLRRTVGWLDAIAGQEVPRTRVNLAAVAFQRQFVQRWVHVWVGSRQDHVGLPEPTIDAISPAPQPPPTAPQSRPKLFAHGEPSAEPNDTTTAQEATDATR